MQIDWNETARNQKANWNHPAALIQIQVYFIAEMNKLQLNLI